MEPEGLLPHSHVPATCLYPQSAQSSPYPHILLPEHHFIIILPSTPGSPKWFISLRFPHQTRVHAFPLPIRATCPAHLILDFKTRTIVGYEYRSFSSSICSFLQSPVTTSLLGPNVLIVLFSEYIKLANISPHCCGTKHQWQCAPFSTLRWVRERVCVCVCVLQQLEHTVVDRTAEIQFLRWTNCLRLMKDGNENFHCTPWRLFLTDSPYLASSKDGEIRQPKPSRAAHSHSGNHAISCWISRNCFIVSTNAFHGQIKRGYVTFISACGIHYSLPSQTYKELHTSHVHWFVCVLWVCVVSLYSLPPTYLRKLLTLINVGTWKLY
jgi:hypothetical protein